MAVRIPLAFGEQCRLSGLPTPEAEVRFHPRRRWRFDWAWEDKKLAVEQDGAVYTAGRHTRGKGFMQDMEKLNSAAALGWFVFRFTPVQMANGEALTFLEPIVRQR